ncbi:MAG: M4 family metallopeptidase, partial [Bacteroidia bacterium]|nr:M4 family metallopeptidase [Bacteroidia bacterium]
MKNFLFLGVLIFFFLSGEIQAQDKLSDFTYPSQNNSWIFFKKGKSIQANTLYEEHKFAFGLNEEEELKLISSSTDEIGFRHDKYQLFHRGIEVEHAIWINHSRANYPIKANGFLPLPLPMWLPTEAQITENKALYNALKSLGDLRYAWNTDLEGMLKESHNDPEESYFPDPQLVITDTDFEFEEYEPVLAYKMEILSLKPVQNTLIYVDATTGEILKKLDNLHTTNTTGTASTAYSGEREIVTDEFEGGFRLREAFRRGGSNIWTLDANNSTILTDASDFIDEDNIWDNFPEEVNRAATDAHFLGQYTYDFFADNFQLNGFDGEGGPIVSYMHYGAENFFNAFFAGTFMAFGDGNGQPLSTPDIYAHEFAHGVTRNSADLIYANESGALNESFSDIFGNTIEYFLDENQFTWYVGEQVGRFRNMANPHEFGDPKIYKGRFWFNGDSDGGGVHTNSGVQNYWYYLIVEGGQGFDDIGRPINVKGIGFQKAMQIAYRNLTTYLTPTSNYEDAKNGSIQAVTDLFGECSFEYKAVVNAWYTAGLGNASQPNDIAITDMEEFEICGDEGDERAITLTLQYNGCDTLNDGILNLSYSVPDLSQADNQSLELKEILPSSIITFTFDRGLELPESGEFTINAGVILADDPEPINNQISRKLNKPKTLKGVEFISFNSVDARSKDSLRIESGEQSLVKILQGIGKEASRGLVIEGGNRTSFFPSLDEDPFELNPAHISRICMCVNATSNLELDLFFDRKQKFSTYYADNFSLDLETNAQLVNNLRVTANGNELARFFPSAENNDTFNTEIIKLDAYAGSQFELCFEGMVHQNVGTDASGVGDRIFLDNIRFDGLKNKPQNGPIDRSELEIDY